MRLSLRQRRLASDRTCAAMRWLAYCRTAATKCACHTLALSRPVCACASPRPGGEFPALGAAARLPPRSPHPLRSRSLLDVEKLEFRTNASGAVVGLAAREPLVLVSASGVPLPRGVGQGGSILVFDIALSPVVHGLPVETLQLHYWLAACLALAALAACCAPVGGAFAVHPWRRRRNARATVP